MCSRVNGLTTWRQRSPPRSMPTFSPASLIPWLGTVLMGSLHQVQRQLPGLAAVDADDHGGALGQPVCASVDRDHHLAFARDCVCCWWFLTVRSLLSITWSNIALPAASASPEAIALTIWRCSLAEIGSSQPSARLRRRNRLSSLISLR